MKFHLTNEKEIFKNNKLTINNGFVVLFIFKVIKLLNIFLVKNKNKIKKNSWDAPKT